LLRKHPYGANGTTVANGLNVYSGNKKLPQALENLKNEGKVLFLKRTQGGMYYGAEKL
jgi:hypothetical protein